MEVAVTSSVVAATTRTDNPASGRITETTLSVTVEYVPALVAKVAVFVKRRRVSERFVSR